jgi:SynChlorMet cassette radical SAM/SPASM protein ScmE
MEVMYTPRSLDLAVTTKCNLRCKYCSHFSTAGDVQEDLGLDEWLAFFEELKECSVMSVTLEGGEPFYRGDIEELIEGIVKNRMRFDILSNGTLITDDIAGFLLSTNRCNGVQVSIDGSTADTHDVFRGEGSFLKALKGIETLKKNNIRVNVRVTIHRKNISDLEKIADLLLDKIGLPGFSTNSASYMGLCRRNSEQVCLTPGERSFAMKTLIELNKKYKGRISASAGPLADARAWFEMEQARIEGRENIPGRGYLTGCGGQNSSLAIRADGVIIPCSQMSHIELGKINRDSLREVWHNHPELKKLRERWKIPLSQFEFCKGCNYINYCSGNCPALAYSAVGNEYHPSPEGCLRLFLDNGGVLPDNMAEV